MGVERERERKGRRGKGWRGWEEGGAHIYEQSMNHISLKKGLDVM